MRRRVLLTVVVGLAVGACGPGTDGASQSVTTTTQAETTTTGPGVGDPSFSCLQGVQAMGAAAMAYANAFSGTVSDPETLAGQISAMGEAAPAAIRADFEVYGEAMGAFLSGLAEIGLQAGVMPTQAQLDQLEELGEAMEDPAVEQALDNIDEWFEADCPG